MQVGNGGLYVHGVVERVGADPNRMADATASVALDHAAGDEVVEEERLDLGGELVGFRSLVVEAVGIACHERAIHVEPRREP